MKSKGTSISLEAVKEALNKNFIYVDQVAEILHLGYITNENVVLFGKGGHGKHI